ncbi:class A beta-lactamase-related serine hydrolase [Sphingomonas koreensis]|nr:class A beta-lactamase-related serine hydrolase [Sphingomonas koreensis]
MASRGRRLADNDHAIFRFAVAMTGPSAEVRERSCVMTKTYLSVFIFSVLATFASGSIAAQAQTSTPTLDAPAGSRGAMVTLYGADLALPPSWTLDRGAVFATIRPPEPGFVMAVVQIDGVNDAAQAAARAWQLVRPGFADPVAGSAPRGAVRGWDAFTIINYDTPASEARVSLAAAFRHGGRWTVFAVQASSNVLERRQAELGQLTSSILPEGQAAETLAGRKPHRLDANRIARLEAFVREAMTKLRIPGAAIALIDHDKIVLEHGIGVRRIGEPEQVDAHTRFMIASNTKGMTTLLIARLVDLGKMRWDQPVAQLYPAIRLADAELTRKLEVRHLICACTGLPRADYETYFVDPGAGAQLAFDQLAQLKPTTEFGSVYQYSNTLAAVAGFVAGHVAYPAMEPGKAYDRAMRALIWMPLGMTETGFDDPRTVKGNFAAPHADRLQGGIGLAPQGTNATLLPFRPTGAAWTSIHDMARYVRNEVTEGRLPDGRQWIAREALLARRIHGVSTGQDSWYGMGVQTQRVGGIETLFHGGAVNGYKSDWLVVPAIGVGAAILTNGENGYPLVTAFRRKLIELLYDARPEANNYVAAEARRIDETLAAQRRTIRLPVPRDADLAGRYVNPLLGTITIRRSNTATVFDFGPWATEIGMRQDDNAPGGIDYVSIAPSEIEDLAFTPGRDGVVRTLTLRDSQHMYVYREK